MNILIIGGQGYIGSALQINLKYKYNIETYGSKQQDYNDLTKESLEKYDYIILLAGHSSVQMCIGSLSSVWNNNVRNFNNLLGKLNKNQKLIYASSSSVYGNKNIGISKESDVSYSYMNNYDLTKLSLDTLAQNYINSGFSIIGLRFGTVNGSSPLIRTDLMINSMVYSALKTGRIEVYNRHIKRSILGINDLAKTIQRIIDSAFIPGIYNLSSFGLDVGQISDVVAKITNVDAIDCGNTNMVYDFLIDNTKILNTFDLVLSDTPENITDEVFSCIKNEKTICVKRNEYYEYNG
jgi:nucleoside-diphosphate-sugar epimerase